MQNVIPISRQLEYFIEYIQKLKQLVGEEKTQFILANSVFIILSGENDILNTCVDNPFRQKLLNDNFFTDRLVNFASSFIQVSFAFHKFVHTTTMNLSELDIPFLPQDGRI